MSALLIFTLMVTSTSGLDLSSFLGIPQLTSVTPEVTPEVVEIVRWRQPVCVVAAVDKHVPPCFLQLNKYQREYEQLSGNGLVKKNTVHAKKSLNTGEVRNNIGIDELDPSSVIQPTEEIRDRIEETPALEAVNNIRRRRDFFHGGKHTVDAAVKPPPIYVTKVLNSPVTATLVAQNCFPDIGLPVCVGNHIELKPNDSPTKIPLELPEKQYNLSVLEAVDDLFLHRPGVKEFVANVTADVEEKFHKKNVVVEPVLLPVENNLTTKSQPKENSILRMIHDLFLHKPGVAEFVAKVSADTEEKLHKHQAIVDEKHKTFQAIVDKKHETLQDIVEKKDQLVETLSNAAAKKKAVVQGIVEKKHEVLQNIAEKKQAAVQGFVDKSSQVLETISNAAAEKKAIIDKSQLVEKKQSVIASITDSISQKKDSMAQVIADKQATVKGIVEKTQNIVQGFIDKTVALELDIANRGQNLVQGIADKKQNLIQSIADKEQSIIQHLADKQIDAIKAISDKTQEIIGTVSVMKPLLISSIQKNLGIGPKQTPIENLDLEATTTKDYDIEESTEVEQLLDERSIGNNSIVAETEAATTTENFYRVIENGSDDVFGRSVGSLDDEELPMAPMALQQEDPEFRTLGHLTKILKKPFFATGKPGILGIFKKPDNNADAAAHKPSSLLSSFLGDVFNHRKPASNDKTSNSSSSSTQAAPILVTGFGDPILLEQQAEVTTVLPDMIAGTEHDPVVQEEEALNSSSSFQSHSLPAFTEEIDEEPDTDQLQVVDDAFTPISKDPPAEVSFAPTSGDRDEPIVTVLESTDASPETKPIVTITDSDVLPVVQEGTAAKPCGNKDGFVIVGDLTFVDDNKADCPCEVEVKKMAEEETIQEI